MKKTKSEIQEYYRDEKRAGGYVGNRFREPLGALLHDRQVGRVRSFLERLPQGRVLEIACGPARLTTDLEPSPDARAVAMDASGPMLQVAAQRIAEEGSDRWRFIQGDAFNLPFEEQFDLVYSFRLIRHFETGDRKRLYQQILRVLKPGGRLVFDAVHEKVSTPLRKASPGDYPVYDVLYDADELRKELEEAGFSDIRLEPVQRHYPILYKLQVLVAPRSRAIARAAMEFVDRFCFGAPLEWVVTCRRP